jgi:hypothetical protein
LPDRKHHVPEQLDAWISLIHRELVKTERAHHRYVRDLTWGKTLQLVLVKLGAPKAQLTELDRTRLLTVARIVDRDLRVLAAPAPTPVATGAAVEEGVGPRRLPREEAATAHAVPQAETAPSAFTAAGQSLTADQSALLRALQKAVFVFHFMSVPEAREYARQHGIPPEMIETGAS